jgi:hypothetical protein
LIKLFKAFEEMGRVMEPNGKTWRKRSSITIPQNKT